MKSVNCAQWSEMVVVMFPVTISSSMMFQNMLSMRVCDLEVTLVGEEMYGRGTFSYIMSRNAAESLFLSYLRLSC